MVSARLATLAELDTVLGVEDLYLLLEIIAIDGHNRQVALKRAERNGHGHGH